MKHTIPPCSRLPIGLSLKCFALPMHQLNSNQGRLIAPIQRFEKRLFPQNDIHEYIKSQRRQTEDKIILECAKWWWESISRHKQVIPDLSQITTLTLTVSNDNEWLCCIKIIKSIIPVPNPWFLHLNNYNDFVPGFFEFQTRLVCYVESIRDL